MEWVRGCVVGRMLQGVFWAVFVEFWGIQCLVCADGFCMAELFCFVGVFWSIRFSYCMWRDLAVPGVHPAVSSGNIARNVIFRGAGLMMERYACVCGGGIVCLDSFQVELLFYKSYQSSD